MCPYKNEQTKTKNRLHQYRSLLLDVSVWGADVVAMVRFEEVLGRVRLALTRASPAEVQTLLKGLVEEQIISGAYRKCLSLQRLTGGVAPQPVHCETACEPGSDPVHSGGSTVSQHLYQGQLGQERKCGSSTGIESAVTDHNQTRSEAFSSKDDGIGMNPLCEHEVIHRYNSKEIQDPSGRPALDLDHRPFSTPTVRDEVTELLRGADSAPKLARDVERMDEGNLEDEEEWLEQVEEASRRIALPLWQHWDRGRRMLLPLVPCMTTGCATSENKAREAQFPVLNTEEEIEVALAGRTLDLSADSFECSEAEVISFTLDAEGLWRHGSPGKARAAMDISNNITDWPEGDLGVCWVAERSSPCTAQDTHTSTQESSFHSFTDHSMTLGAMDNVENVFRAAYGTETGSTGGIMDLCMNKEDAERVDAHCGAKMEEVNQDPSIWGDLPDDLSEYMNEDYLRTIVDDVLFGDPWLNSMDELNNCCDVPMPTALPSPGSHQQGGKDKLTGKTNNRRKRTRAQWCTDENTPSRPKRQRASGRLKTKKAQSEPAVTRATDWGSEPSSAEMAGLSTTPPRILHLHPSIQFITIPDTPQYQVVQTLRLSPPVIGLPLPNTAAPPTYILVPAASPPCKHHVPPLSPVNGAVAPVQMSSSPQGSLSDAASKAMAPPCASPPSPSHEMSACLPQRPAVLDIPQVVKDYIQEAKAHMSEACQCMEAGFSLTSHYVDVQVSQRDILRSGKNTNKILDKELVIMGHTDQQKSMLSLRQIFKGSNGDKPRYIMLFGKAGMGKTTLIRKLCLDWSRDCIPQFDFVFLLDGKALTSTEPTHSLQTLLLNLSPFAPSCLDPEAVYAQILGAPKRVLIIFDGFGELRDYETLLQTQEKDSMSSLQKDSKAQTYTVRQLYSAILQRLLLPGCTLLLSTRPRGAASQLLRRTDSLLEVCGFNPTDVETYLSQYFTDPALRASALECLKNCSYLQLLCWNPGLCRLVCLVLEESKGLEVLPRTLTGLCHQVLGLKMEEDSRNTHLQAEAPTQIPVQSVEETQTQISRSSRVMRCRKNTWTTSRAEVRNRSCIQRKMGAEKQEEEEGKVGGEEMKADRTEEKELLPQLSYLAWEGVKTNSSILPTGRTLSAKLKAFGHRTGLFLSYHLRTRQSVSGGKREGGGGGGEEGEKMGRREKKKQERERKETGERLDSDAGNDHILVWANPFLQSYLAGVHLALSRTVLDRTFLQSLPFHSGSRGRRRPQREELELTQRFAVGLLFHNRTELQRLHSYTEAAFRNTVASRRALVIKHLEGLSHDDLSPAQVLEACHYVYEASSTHGGGSRDTGSTRLVTHLAANLPEVLTFVGVPLKPSDVFAVQNVLERGGRRFCLDLEDSGIQISELRSLVGLNNINTYRACIADVIALWEQLEQSGEEELLRGAVSKLKIDPLKATQVCHIEQLAKLVNIHMHKRLSDSSSQSDPILAEGVPAVKELHKLEFELGPENGPLALTKLWELLPGLPNLQHLDLEKCKIGDNGAEKLADALVSLCFLEVLNLSQNCIGDQGVKTLAARLRELPKLHCLSLYSNVISDEGAASLAAVLPHMASLTDLDVTYNKLTDVGVQSLGASLRNCKKMRTLRMWNQCIPYGVFERLQQQDNRILWH